MFDLERIKQRAKLTRPLLVPLILYIGLLVFFVSYNDSHPNDPSRYIFAFLPMLPALYIANGIVKLIQQYDELERKTLVDGIIASFMLTLILLIGYSFFEAAGFPSLNAAYIGTFMWVVLGVGKLWSMRRFQ
jgi:hypothetical protein